MHVLWFTGLLGSVVLAHTPLLPRQANSTCDDANPVLASIEANPDPTGFCYTYLAPSTITVIGTQTAYHVVTRTTPIAGTPLTETTTYTPPLTTTLPTTTITNSAFTVTFTTTFTTPNSAGCATNAGRKQKRQTTSLSSSVCSTLMSSVYAVVASGDTTTLIPVSGTEISVSTSTEARSGSAITMTTASGSLPTSPGIPSMNSTTSPSSSTTSAASISDASRTASVSYAPSAISAACGCLSVPTPASTYVVTTTVMPTVTNTATLYDYVTSTPIFTEIPTSYTILPPVTLTTTVYESISACPCPPITGTAPVFLSAPTAIHAADLDNPDDGYTTIDLQGTSIGLYNQFPNNFTMSVNGFLGIVGSPMTSSSNVALPDFPPPTNGFGTYLPGTAAVALWDDYTLEGANPNLGLYWQFDPSVTAEDARDVTFEWYVNSFTDSSPYHFLARFEEARPTIVSFTFLQVPDSGSTGTSGVQSQQAGNQFAQLSFNQADLMEGAVVEFDSSSNSFQYVQFGVCQTGS